MPPVHWFTTTTITTTTMKTSTTIIAILHHSSHASLLLCICIPPQASCPASFQSCIPPVMYSYSSFPASLQSRVPSVMNPSCLSSFLSFISSVFHFPCHASLLSSGSDCILSYSLSPFRPPFCPALFLSGLPLVLPPSCS